MSGICGWLELRGGVSDPAETLGHMADGIRVPEGSARSAQATPNAAVCASGPARTSDIFSEGDIWAAIQGHPRWTDNDLSGRAVDQGHAAVLARTYRENGPAALDGLRGDWSLVIIDRREKAVFAAVDRMGVSTLCHAAPDDDTFVFGATIDSLVAHPTVRPELNFQALYDYLYFTRSPAPGSIYHGLQKLLPGHYVMWKGGKVETRPYWKLKYQASQDADLEALADEFRELLRRVVARACDGWNSEALGTFLSGGTDSSTVTGVLAALSDAPVKAFSIGFDQAGYDETEFAQESASHFSADLHSYIVTPADIVDFVPHLAEIYDEPFGNTSAVAAYYCARLAAENGIKCLLAGDGGDELFGGNTRYVDQNIFEAYHSLPGGFRRAILEPVVSGLPAWLGPLARKPKSYVARANIPLPDRLESYNFYRSQSLGEYLEPDIAEKVDAEHPVEILRMHYNSANASERIGRMMHLDLRTTLADDDLRKVTQTAGFAGLTVGYPLLDDDLVEFSGRIPANLHLKGGKLRYFFKHALKDFLPRSTLTKKKQGFGLPYGAWLKSDSALQAITYDSLAKLKTRGIFRPAFLDGAIESHRSGHASHYGEVLWVLMLLELWLEKHHDTMALRATGRMRA